MTELLFAFTIFLAAFGGTDVEIRAKDLDACKKLQRLVKVQLTIAGVEYNMSECKPIEPRRTAN